MERKPELPPAVQIAISEQLWRFSTATELSRHLRSRGLISEFRRQSAWTREEFLYPDRNEGAPETSQLVVTPAGSLNPFSPVGKCSSDTCRAKAAANFVQTVALYSDAAYVPDPLTGLFVHRGGIVREKAEYLQATLQVLRVLNPLIQAGVVRLGSPFGAYCRTCYKATMDTLSNAADELARASLEQIHAQYYPNISNPVVGIRNPLLYPEQDHPLMTIYPLTPDENTEYLESCGPGRRSRKNVKCRRFLLRLMRARLKHDITKVFFELALSQRTHSLLLAGSRVEPLVLSSIDHNIPPVGEIQNWERLRSLELPWLHELNSEEIMILRDQASKALPRLRQLLLNRVASPHPTATNISAAMEELQGQLYEVEDELAAIGARSRLRYSVGMGGLSMLFVIYGFASGVPQLAATSMAAFFATLGHLRKAERDHDATMAKVEGKPAYALLMARRILERRQRDVDR